MYDEMLHLVESHYQAADDDDDKQKWGHLLALLKLAKEAMTASPARLEDLQEEICDILE